MRDPKLAQMIAEIMMEEIQLKARKRQLDEKKKQLEHYKSIMFEKKVTKKIANG